MILQPRSPVAIIIVRLFRAFQLVLVAQVSILGILSLLPKSCSEGPLIFLMMAYQPAFALFRGLVPKSVCFLGNIPLGLAGIIFSAMLYSFLGAMLWGGLRGFRRDRRTDSTDGMW